MTVAPLQRFIYRGNGPFTWLLWSQTISLFGSQVSLVAIPLLAALSLGANAFEMGLLAAVETGAYLLISVPAGVLADRVDRRRLLIASNLGRAGLLLAIPAGAALGSLSLPLLYAVASGVGVLSALFDVTYQSYVPELLAPGDLLKGNQRIELSESAARTAGPGLAGGLIGALGGSVAVIVDAVSYLVASVALLGASRAAKAGAAEEPLGRRQETAGPPPADDDELTPMGRTHGGGAWAGFRIVLRDRVLRDMAISTGIFNLASSAIMAVFILFAARDLAMNAATIGILIGVSNIGFVVGALAVGAVTARFGIGRTLTMSAVLGAIATILLPFASGPTALGFLFGGRFIGALAIPLFNVNARAFRQSRSPLATLGRVNAVFRLIDWGTLPIGALLGGWIGTVYGLYATLAVGGLLGIASAAWLLASPLRHVRGLEFGAEHRRDELSPVPSEARLRLRVRGFGEAIADRMAAIGRLHLRWTWLAIAGFALQLALFLPAVNVFGAATPILYVLSCAAVLACVIRNVRIPGLAVIALGGVSNLLVIVLNGGFMPVTAESARAAGQLPPSGYVTTIDMTSPVLQPLTDIIVVPQPLPLANVYSVGDLLIVIGLSGTLVWTLRKPVPSRRRDGSTVPGQGAVDSSAPARSTPLT